MTRWRVKFSRRTPTWFHACEIDFVDAIDAAAAEAQVESRSTPDNQFEVWAITPATPAMEAAHLEWLARCATWKVAAAKARAHRSML